MEKLCIDLIDKLLSKKETYTYYLDSIMYDNITDDLSAEDLKEINKYRNKIKRIYTIVNYIDNEIRELENDEIVVEEKQKESEIEGVNCPLCGEKLVHEEYNGTHLYKCPSCPIVAMEDVEQKDINNMFENLMKDFTREENGDNE